MRPPLSTRKPQLPLPATDDRGPAAGVLMLSILSASKNATTRATRARFAADPRSTVAVPRQPRISRLILLSLLSACSCSSKSSPEISPEQFAAQFNSALCGFIQRCSPVSEYAACDPSVLVATAGVFSRTVSAGRVVFNAGQAQGCLEAIGGLGCPAYADAFDVSALNPPACRAALRGNIATGASCYGTNECVDGFCDLSSECPGTCVAYAESGDACSDGPCDPSMSCIKGKCAARLASGTPCTSNGDCQTEFFCSGKSHKCTNYGLGSVGSTCATIDDCAQGSYCLYQSGIGTCTAQVQAGANCGEDVDHVAVVDSECAQGLICARYSYNSTRKVAAPGICAVPSDVGGPCIAIKSTLAGNTGCLSGLVCQAGLCAIPPTSGKCVDDPAGPQCDARAAYCDAGGTCRVLLNKGKACADSLQCKSGICSGMCLSRCELP